MTDSRLNTELERHLKSLPPETRTVLEILLAHYNANHSDVMAKFMEIEKKTNIVYDLYINMSRTSKFMVRILAGGLRFFAWALATVAAMGVALTTLKAWFSQ